jgi:hypothetical protein
MNRAITGFIIVVVVAVCSVATQAATPTPSNNTYVSYRGVDTNPCTRVLPCRTVTQALTLTNDGGEVHIIDTGEYAGFGVTKDVTVAADAGVTAAFGPIGVNGGNVALKNLQILNATPNAITLNGGTLIVEDATFFNNSRDIFNNGGLWFNVRRCHFNGNPNFPAGAIVTNVGKAA